MKKFHSILFVMICVQVNASHIVGGEFQMFHISGNQYRFNLVYYFDVINNGFGGVPPEQTEPTITASIFRNSSNTFMRSVVLAFISRTTVHQTNPACASGMVQTQLVTYSAVVYLAPDEYDDAHGYYIAWERCCRNYSLTNIYSFMPGASNDPFAAGQTFILEFPPVVKDGVSFINSSPRIFSALSDYACSDRRFYADFHAVDEDGDSLVYSMATPLSTHQTVAVPPIAPKPYPEVTWRFSYGPGNIMHGEPDIAISKDGLLTVVPKELGLYGFAVKIEEFRDGVKIGEVRRDFQILVADVCPPANAPEILVKTNSGSYAEEGAVNFSDEGPPDQRCATIKISDADALVGTDQIVVRAIPLNFSADISSILPDITTFTLNQSKPGAEVSVCFNRCSPWQLSDFQVGVIAYDASCSLPLTDTVKVNVHIPVEAPKISAGTPAGSFSEEQLNVEFTGAENDEDRCVVVRVTDDDALLRSQSISIKAIPVGYSGDVSSILPEVTTAILEPASTSKDFKICFNKCGLLNRTNFQIGIIAIDGCDKLATDTVVVNVQMPVTCLPQTITFPVITDKTIGDAPFALNATSSSGLPITYASSNTSKVSILSGIAVMNAPGKIMITASQGGNQQYAAATPIERSFCVNPMAPEIQMAQVDEVPVIISNIAFGNLWFKDGVPLDTITSALIFEDETAEYTARIEIDGCVSELSNSILITSVSENPDQQLQLYPNPADNAITIRHTEGANEKKIEVIDILGNVVFTHSSSQPTDTIDIHNLKAGVYIVKVHNGKKVTSRRILKR